MTKPLSLDSFVSGGIARSNPLENTPELEAALHRRNFVPNTWGGYATALMDQLDIEPNEALAMLGITSEELADPTLQFSPKDFHNNPHDYFTRKFYSEAKADLKIEERRLERTVDTIATGWVVDDKQAANEEADKLQEEIERTPGYDAVKLLCAKRDALYDGISVTADEFVRTMLDANVLDDEAPSELAKEWIRSIFEAVEYVAREFHLDEDTKLSEIFLGQDAVREMRFSINCDSRAVEISNERWEQIAPVFVARSLGEFSLFAGTES